MCVCVLGGGGGGIGATFICICQLPADSTSSLLLCAIPK